MKNAILVLTLVCGSAAVAQPQTQVPPQSGFPEPATAPSAAELRDKLAGKVFRAKLADGGFWRLEYKANGYFFINTHSGFSDTGKWQTKDGALCSEASKIKANCNEVRVHGDAIYLKRDSGEVVQLVAQ